LPVKNSLVAKELENDHPILAVRDRDSPCFDLLGTEQDQWPPQKELVPARTSGTTTNTMKREIPEPNRSSWGRKTLCDQVGNGYRFDTSCKSAAIEDASTLQLRFA